MFGGSFGTPEPENTIFRDHQAAGSVHWVQWQTAQPVTLRSFALFAAHDGPPYDAHQRGFSRFTLFTFDESTGSFEKLYEIFPANPYGDTSAPADTVIETNPNKTFLNLAANLVPTTTELFAAEFVQYGDSIPTAAGPRIVELDGFETFHPAVPEPSTLILLAMGGLGIFVCAARQRRNGRTN
jgi:hypothetical protein